MTTISGKTHYTPVNSNDYGSGKYGDFIDYYVSRFNLNLDPDWTLRQCKLYILKLFYHGNIYNNLAPWWSEYDGSGEAGKYIPLLRRRPSVIYNLPKIIVDKSVSMLFGEEHFPIVRCSENNQISDFLQYVCRKGNFRYSMLNAARKGAIGSVCVIVKVLEGRFHLDVLGTTHLIPIFSQVYPGVLDKLYEKKKVIGETLIQLGYEVKKDDFKKMHYLLREWSQFEEIYYMPVKCEDYNVDDYSPIKDEKKSTKHDWGFVPAVWIKNSPECHHIDGKSSFGSVLDICIELDYQVSQLARLLRYNSDPTMVIKDPSLLGGENLMKGGGNALVLGRDGDAYMLETTGASTKSVIDFVRLLREYALEVVRGDRSNPDKMNAAHSGKALQMLQSALISMVDELRLCYGDNGLLKIYQMILKMCATNLYKIDMGGNTLPKNGYENSDITLDYPDWYPATPQDDVQEAQSISTLLASGIISQETAVTSVSDKYGIIDIQKELKLIKESDNLEKPTSQTGRGSPATNAGDRQGKEE